MGLFDYFIPDPAIACPKCSTGYLEDWQGKHEENCLFVWQQGVAHPIEQRVDEESRLSDEELSRLRLPLTPPIVAYGGECHACGYELPMNLYSIILTLDDGIWTGVCFDEPPLMGIPLDSEWLQCPSCMDAFHAGSRDLYVCEACEKLVLKPKT